MDNLNRGHNRYSCYATGELAHSGEATRGKPAGNRNGGYSGHRASPEHGTPVYGTGVGTGRARTVADASRPAIPEPDIINETADIDIKWNFRLRVWAIVATVVLSLCVWRLYSELAGSFVTKPEFQQHEFKAQERARTLKTLADRAHVHMDDSAGGQK